MTDVNPGSISAGRIKNRRKTLFLIYSFDTGKIAFSFYYGKNVVFPDIRRLENLMRAELQREALTAQIIAEAKQEAADRLRSITQDPTEGRRR